MNDRARLEILPKWICLVSAVLWCGTSSGCTTDRKQPNGGDVHERPSVRDLNALPENSVGSEASRYALGIERVRVWYAIIEEVNLKARSDSSLRLKLNYPFTSPLPQYVEQLQRLPGMMATLAKHDMSPKEFILLTTLLSTGWGAMTLVDSLGPASTPVNVGAELITFMKSHRVELDSLRRRIDN